MLMFAEALDPTLLSQLLSQAGPAALAALAVWWLTNKHEKVIDRISQGISDGQARVAESLDKMDLRHEARDKERHEQDEQKIKILADLVTHTNNMDDRLEETNRRMEAIEKVMTDVHRVTSNPPCCSIHLAEKSNGKVSPDSIKKIVE